MRLWQATGRLYRPQTGMGHNYELMVGALFHIQLYSSFTWTTAVTGDERQHLDVLLASLGAFRELNIAVSAMSPSKM